MGRGEHVQSKRYDQNPLGDVDVQCVGGRASYGDKRR